MGSISELLRYKKEVFLTHPQTGEKMKAVWVRILGDEDIKESFKYSRLASADFRAKLRDETSVDYQLHIKSLEEQDDKDLYDLILAAKVNDFTRESVAVIAREELPKLEEIAVEPDAPTLKEQEQLDKEELATEQRFTDAIQKYVNERKVELEATLKKTKRTKLVEMAKQQMADMIPTQAFLAELADQKGYRGTYIDKDCKTRAFLNIDDYKNTAGFHKDQIMAAYDELEMGPDDIKN